MDRPACSPTWAEAWRVTPWWCGGGQTHRLAGRGLGADMPSRLLPALRCSPRSSAPPQATRLPRAHARAPCFPFPAPGPTALCCLTHRLARPACPCPGCPSRMARVWTRDGVVFCTSVPGPCPLPPVLAVNPSGLPCQVLESHSEAGRRTQLTLGTQGSAGHSPPTPW